ncbi:uncharacterized protein BX663DRAFT_522593, partial [Cokeromyces recurvatus]|uniref:uncharacterized protein n=1 Tax=Cokeromyces recurvatus TaxID=90255 RepID=UPI00221F573B
EESNGDLIVVTIDEYLTSQVCSKCMTKRDINASLNIMKIAQSIWRDGERPLPFKRG